MVITDLVKKCIFLHKLHKIGYKIIKIVITVYIFYCGVWNSADNIKKIKYAKNVLCIYSTMTYCTICMGRQQFNFLHISGHIHRSNLARLPYNFHLMTDKQIYDYLHKSKAK